jgi:hypothetical protein
MAVPIDAGAATELVIDEHYPIDLAVDVANLHWIDHERPDAERRRSSPPKRIRKLVGGNTLTLATTSDAVGIEVDAHCVYWTETRPVRR